MSLAPLPVAIPVLVAAIVLPVGRHLPRWLLDSVTVGAAAAVVGVDAALLDLSKSGRVVTWLGGWQPKPHLTVGIVLVVGPMGAGLALLAAGLVTMATLYAARYFEDVHGHLHAVMLLFLAGMDGFALTGDLFDMLVFFELTGAAAYALTGMRVEDPTSVQGALNFGIINSLGAYLTLTGIGVLYAHTGQLGLAQLGASLGAHPGSAGLLTAAFVLICTGFLVKAAVVPFHFWTADAEAVAPSPVCTVLSGAMVVLGVYAVGRVWFVIFAGSLPAGEVHRALLVLGTASAVVGAVMCFAQRHLKRLLAYSTISHVGLFVIALATLHADGVAGAAIYVVGHASVKGALFLLAGLVLNRYGSVDELDLYGRGRRARVLPWLWIVGGLALACLPPFATGLGKAVSEDALIKDGVPWAPAVYVLAAALTGGAVLRAALRIYFGLGPRPAEAAGRDEAGEGSQSETDEPLPRTPPTMLVPVAVLLAAGFAVGVLPGAGHAFGRAAAFFVDGAGYRAQALTATGHPGAGVALAAPTPASVGWTALGVGLGLVSAALAAGFAVAAVYAPRLPGAARAAAAPFARGLGVLRRVHSGHIGDYVAWMFVGVGVLGALIGLPLR